jgi:hypothetical protein
MRFVLRITCFSLIFTGYSLTAENFAGAVPSLPGARLELRKATDSLFFGFIFDA